ncbi:hypothetical protein YPPY66_1168, partial [Yersinia pestis PY-66]
MNLRSNCLYGHLTPLPILIVQVR